ncbi:MAG TPA: dTDP-4-dehydrorhamnose 3,5-epimerase family protein [Burkholderiales bacterium]|nr:dTDP-4-dehydrorhamnose 3,5-epimerase family protein [Burkholderiales bacterium]
MESGVILEPAAIPGAYTVELERNVDERGFFARTWCREEFARAGLRVDVVQASISHNRLRGTLRGLHFAWPPSKEAKLVRCERGQVFDVIVDLRPESPAFLRHVAVTLDAVACNALYIPPGVAHGFQTLADDCTVFYMMTEAYLPELADGVRFDDPAFGVTWPLPVSSIHPRDRGYPDFDATVHEVRHRSAGEGERIA